MHCIFLLRNSEKCLTHPGMGFAKLMPKLTFRTRPHGSASYGEKYHKTNISSASSIS